MRSNKNQATRFLLRRNLFIGVAVFLVAFYMMPFWGLSHIPNEKAAVGEYYSPEAMTQRLEKIVSSEVMTSQLNLEMMVILYGGLGFLTAMMLMRHQFSRRQSMLHAALPDRRETDFLRRCAGYAVLCLAPIVLNFLLYLLAVAANGLLAYVAWDVLLPKFGVLLLINLYGFAMGMLCSVLTGTYWAAILAGAVLIVGMEALAGLWYWIASRYLYTLTEDSFMNALLHVSPAFSLYKGFYKPAEFVWLPGTAVIVLALALSFALCRIRRTERAEHTLAFAPLHSILGFVLPLLGGTFLGVVVETSFLSEISLIAGMVLGAVLTYWGCRIVFNQRFCGILRRGYWPAASAAVLVLGVVVLHTDALGYDRFLPERKELTAISYRSSRYGSECVTLTGEDALDAAYAWCGLMRDEVSGLESGFGVKSGAFSGSDVVVTYQLGGRKVIRHYPNRTMRTEAQDSLRRIIESDDYRQSLIGECQLDTGAVTEMYLSSERSVMHRDEFYERFGMIGSLRGFSRVNDSARMDEMLGALKQDILKRTFEEKQEDAVLCLDLTIQLPDTRSTLYRSVSIYPGDTNFLKAAFGERAQEITDYVTGGYADSGDVVILKADYVQSLREIRDSDIAYEDAEKTVAVASSPEQAKQWLQKSQSLSARDYYYMPYLEELPYSRLYIYLMSEVEKYSDMCQYEVPQDRAKLCGDARIPTVTVLDYAGGN